MLKCQIIYAILTIDSTQLVKVWNLLVYFFLISEILVSHLDFELQIF